MNEEEYKELIAAEIAAEKEPPVEAYQQLPFTVSLNYVRYIIALLLGFYALYLTSTLFENLHWRDAFNWDKEFDWKMYSLYPHVAAYSLAVFAYFMFLFRLLFRGDKLLEVNEVGVKFYGYPNIIRWQYVLYVARKGDKVTMGLNPVMYLEKSKRRKSLMRILMGDWHYASYPSFNAFFMNADMDALTHAIKYHLRKYKDENPENIKPPSDLY